MHGFQIDFNVFVVFLCFFLIVLPAGGQELEEKISGITLEYRSPVCESYCRLQFTAIEQKIVRLETPGIVTEKASDRLLRRNTHSLSPVKWKAITDACRINEIRALPEIHQCPGCNENVVGRLSLVTNKAIIERVFEGNDPPEVLKKLIFLLESEFAPQYSPEAYQEYFVQAHKLTRLLARKAIKMDSILMELDSLERNLR